MYANRRESKLAVLDGLTREM